MGNEITLAKQRGLIRNWQWRERGGAFTYPADMETRHLFHTLRMIWNNSMPAKARVGAVSLYHFHSYYTVEYMAEAIFHLFTELSLRTDIATQWRLELMQMEAWFNTPERLLA